MGNRVSIDPEAGEIRAIRRLRESGNSVVLTIPRQVLDGAGLEEGDDVLITAEMGRGEFRVEAAPEDPDPE